MVQIWVRNCDAHFFPSSPPAFCQRWFGTFLTSSHERADNRPSFDAKGLVIWVQDIHTGDEHVTSYDCKIIDISIPQQALSYQEAMVDEGNCKSCRKHVMCTTKIIWVLFQGITTLSSADHGSSLELSSGHSLSKLL